MRSNPSLWGIVDPVCKARVLSTTGSHAESVRRARGVSAIPTGAGAPPFLIHATGRFRPGSIVAECWENLATSRGYSTGGTIHVPHQQPGRGSPTNPDDARSTPYGRTRPLPARARIPRHG